MANRGTAMKRALRIILGVSLFGVLFSSVLSYRELFAGAASCPSPGGAGTVLGYPACVYGLFMYLLVSGTAFWGLRSGRRSRAQKNGERKARTTEPIPGV